MTTDEKQERARYLTAEYMDAMKKLDPDMSIVVVAQDTTPDLDGSPDIVSYTDSAAGNAAGLMTCGGTALASAIATVFRDCGDTMHDAKAAALAFKLLLYGYEAITYYFEDFPEYIWLEIANTGRHIMTEAVKHLKHEDENE